MADTLVLYDTPNAVRVDRVEAWHRADRYFGRRPDGDGQLLIAVEDFGFGYRARQTRIRLPDPPANPTLDTETTLVVDKTTGRLTLWPLLPTSVLTDLYLQHTTLRRA